MTTIEAFGPFVIDELIAETQMTAIGKTTFAGRPAAIKFLSHHVAGSGEHQQLLEREGVILERVQGTTGIVRLLERGSIGERPYLVLEMLAGIPLRVALDEGSAPPVESLLAQLAPVIAHLGAREVVHGDWTPANLVVDPEGSCTLIDFGIAWAPSLFPGDDPTSVRGTWGYMAPEQARGELLSSRTDVYGLGLLLGERILADSLLPRTREPRTLMAMAQGVAKDAAVFELAPVWLRAMLHRMLAHSPADRPSPEELAAFASRLSATKRPSRDES
ncbi:MAG: serine/threonine protein kinase [Myxococcales bacterium]|nr:serine/threonine protein kinase [Myxococcales bacterium]